MVIVAGAVTLNPERREDALALMRWMEAETRKEAACISYEFSVSVDDPNRALVFERWEDGEGLKAHFQAAHMTEFRAKLPGLIQGGVDILQFEVAPPPAD